ncbi:Ppx/GppA phosphatase family protein [uncultured Paludibaculum sp.]|uniref:Ppx/GppA phosphatase family protein n=1 Tax=uncultured Paludibaculum sp. TaxID=1765020 RepID=UPI002AAB1706|nr:Ppx/GppA phosphatase family protein [uncultured Paludibaculum sp.]
MPRYAAIDIGSNSVRMMAAETERGGPLKVLAEDRQVTRLGESVFRTGSIAAPALDFLCGVLARMVAAYKPLGVLATRVVATSAVRDASNGEEFVERVNAVLGQPVEIISGQEEARLIHLGVETRWPHPDERILIIDIGGGSAEIIEAERGTMKAAFSRPLGAVRLQSVFLQNDPPPFEDLRRMGEFIEEKLAVVTRRIEKGGFARAIGTSASASAIVCAANRIPRARRPEADRRRASLPQIRRLYKALASMKLEERRKVVGIGPRRAEIILPGAAVLTAVMEHFQIPQLAYCSAGVRDGLLRDLAERGVGRERTRLDNEQRIQVEQFARRFGVDLRHARRVAIFARELFQSLEPWHRLSPEQCRLLEASAYLRDVGHAINDMSHHKHSQYIVANSDIAGFTDLERIEVAMLCRYHRKAMPGGRHQDFLELPAESQKVVLLLAPILRIADALDRSRDQRVAGVECEIRNGAFCLTIEASEDTGLEQWAVERVAPQFRQVYQKPLAVTSTRI